MFNNRRFASSSSNYSCFSQKCHNYDTFTLAAGLIILTFCHLTNVLSNWKFISRFLPDLVSIYNFSRKILYLSMIGVYVDLKISPLRASTLLHNFDVVCISETYLDSTTALDDENLEIAGPIMRLIVREAVFVYIIKVHLL